MARRLRGADAAVVCVSVAVGGSLPAIGGTFTAASPLTGYIYVVRVTAIRALRWLPSGEIEVTVAGQKQAIGDGWPTERGGGDDGVS